MKSRIFDDLSILELNTVELENLLVRLNVFLLFNFILNGFNLVGRLHHDIDDLVTFRSTRNLNM